MRRIGGAVAVAALVMAVPALAETGGTSGAAGGLLAYNRFIDHHVALVVERPGVAAHVFSRPGLDALTPRWSPDGRWIAFSGCDNAGSCQLYVVHPDGSALRRVTHDSEGLFTPSWMPDGHTLLAGRHEIDTPDAPIAGSYTVAGSIVRVSLRTGTETTVVQDGDQELLYPTWSASAQVVVFSAGTDQPIMSLTPQGIAGSDVVTDRVESVHLDGSNLKVLAVGQSPDVSQSGDSVAYTGGPTEQGDLMQVHVVSIDGKRDRLVGSFGWAGINPTWAPDDQSLLVSAEDNPDEVHVVRMNVATGLTADLTAQGSGTFFADQAPTGVHPGQYRHYRATKTYLQSPTGDAGWPMDNCGMPDQGPGIGGVCFNVGQGDVVRVTLTDLTGRPVAGFIDVCGQDDCATARTTWLARPVCGAVTLDLASVRHAFHMWVEVDPLSAVAPSGYGGACPLPAPGTRGRASADYLS